MPTPVPRRLRRLRSRPLLRALVRETSLAASDLVWPVFVADGVAGRTEIPSLPGQHRHGLDALLRACEEAAAAGVRALCLFGLPGSKDERGSGAWAEDGIVQRALRALRAEKLPLLLTADACLCQFTSHGHCGILRDGRVDNDATVPLLARVACSLAEAGAEVIVPSDMMDGRVAAMRASLDGADFGDVAILSHAVKYASAWYGPFREAADSAPSFGDRRTHQMDPGNVREAVRSARRDVAEGADMVLVKPGLPCLDVVRAVKEAVDVPVGAYAVSGEYAMIEAAAAAGWIDRDAVLLENLTGYRRAGADLVVTYHAVEAARLLAREA